MSFFPPRRPPRTPSHSHLSFHPPFPPQFLPFSPLALFCTLCRLFPVHWPSSITYQLPSPSLLSSFPSAPLQLRSTLSLTPRNIAGIPLALIAKTKHMFPIYHQDVLASNICRVNSSLCCIMQEPRERRSSHRNPSRMNVRLLVLHALACHRLPTGPRYIGSIEGWRFEVGNVSLSLARDFDPLDVRIWCESCDGAEIECTEVRGVWKTLERIEALLKWREEKSSMGLGWFDMRGWRGLWILWRWMWMKEFKGFFWEIERWVGVKRDLTNWNLRFESLIWETF